MREIQRNAPNTSVSHFGLKSLKIPAASPLLSPFSYRRLLDR